MKKKKEKVIQICKSSTGFPTLLTDDGNVYIYMQNGYSNGCYEIDGNLYTTPAYSYVKIELPIN